ncbi:hypothetical protein BC828DRAFT_372783 [Blastocladiella britannica]|nr:hypothetical protein BC828DRAFT_372783 [Blastocladiella britannica]
MAARSSSPSTSHGRANDAGPLRLADLGGTNTTLGPDHHPPGRRSPSPSLSLSTLSSAGGGGGGQGMYPRLDDPTVTMPRYPDVHDTDSGHLSPRSPVNTNNDASAMSTLAFAFTESDAALADEFAESLTLVFRGDLPSGGPALFDHYAAICERRVECLVGERDDAAHNKRPTAILDTLDAELVGVRAEAQSWRLIESILSWRMGHVDAPTLPPNPIHSDRLIEADALSRNTDGLLELKLVQRWLENHLDKFLDKKLVSLSVSAVRTGTLDAAGTVPAPAGPDSTETLFKAIFALLQAGNRDLAILTAESTSNPWVADAIRGSDRWHATADGIMPFFFNHIFLFDMNPNKCRKLVLPGCGDGQLGPWTMEVRVLVGGVGPVARVVRARDVRAAVGSAGPRASGVPHVRASAARDRHLRGGRQA